jgi:hypothetical protein
MDLATRFRILSQKQIALQEGIEMLRETQRDLAKSRATGNIWGITAVLANATIIPLNVIINAYGLGPVKSRYDAFAHALYARFSASKTRIDGPEAEALEILKKTLIDLLKAEGATDYIPGVRVLVGLSQDTLALWKKINMVQNGSNEAKALAANADAKLNAMTKQLRELGIKQNEIFGRLQAMSRIV